MEDKKIDTDVKNAEEPIEKKKPAVLWPILIILTLLAGGGAFYWRDTKANEQKDSDNKTITSLRKDKSDLEKELAEAKKTASSTSTSCTALPTASVKENVIASITSKNTAALESYMAPSVHVVIAASEAAYDRTPTKAVEDIKYVINAEEPWNFALSTATIDTFKAGFYKDYFKDNSVVGVAKDKRTVVFNFNCSGNGKIDGVFMAVSSDLLTE